MQATVYLHWGKSQGTSEVSKYINKYLYTLFSSMEIQMGNNGSHGRKAEPFCHSLDGV